MKKILTYLILVISLRGFSQQELMISQYMFNGLYLNPAYAGSHSYTEVTGLYRQQWTGFTGAPVSQIVSADGNVKNTKIGWGAILNNDRIGVTYKTDLYGNYAYHLPLGKEGRLSMGLRAGFSYYRALLNQLTVWDGNDQVFNNNIQNKFLPNAGVGLYYYTKKLYAGLSAPNLLNYDPNTFMTLGPLLKESPNYVRHGYISAGYVIEANENLHFRPSVLVKYVKNAPVEADFNLNVLINRAFWVGASYRTGDCLVGLLEYQHGSNWRIGYAYDFAITKIQKYNSGSHEIMFSYMFVKTESMKIKSPRFF
ncbi:MAG: PorP/SprF family type IX secretion system membrane protein [Bacteroidia bacterium]